MQLLEEARENLYLAGMTSWAYLSVFAVTTILVSLAFFRCSCDNSCCPLETCCACQIGCECVVAILCLAFGSIAIHGYHMSINAIIDLEELTNGCMDEFTTIPVVVIENVLTYTAD